jgi:hypothetical protein
MSAYAKSLHRNHFVSSGEETLHMADFVTWHGIGGS